MITAAPWSSSDNAHHLIRLAGPLLASLASSDLSQAISLTTYALPPYLISPECLSTWRRRLDQIFLNPSDAIWVTRLIVFTHPASPASSPIVVGRAGFHGPPDSKGMVEVGYAIDPAERGKGHAKAALRILIDVARRDERVMTVRASVGTQNVASRALVDSMGFKEVGQQWDEEDGMEIVLEIAVGGEETGL
jgi:[ribosomal protein S5]-alanine N-acetyltransferase